LDYDSSLGVNYQANLGMVPAWDKIIKQVWSIVPAWDKLSNQPEV